MVKLPSHLDVDFLGKQWDAARTKFPLSQPTVGARQDGANSEAKHQNAGYEPPSSGIVRPKVRLSLLLFTSLPLLRILWSLVRTLVLLESIDIMHPQCAVHPRHLQLCDCSTQRHRTADRSTPHGNSASLS